MHPVLAGVITILLGLAVMLAPSLIIRILAKVPFYWTYTPLYTFAIVVHEDFKSEDIARDGGGGLVKLLNGVPGWRIDDSAPNPMNWEYVEETDPAHQTWLYRTLGVQSMGSIWWTLRTNMDVHQRFTAETAGSTPVAPDASGKQPPRAVIKAHPGRFVFFEGEITVFIPQADTADKLGLAIEIDLIFRRKFPLRSMVRLAEPLAFLASKVEEAVNFETGLHPAENYIGGENSRKMKQDLANYLDEPAQRSKYQERLLEQLGLEIMEANLRSVDMTAAHRKFLALKLEAEKQGEAEIIRRRRLGEAAEAEALGNKKAAITESEGRLEARRNDIQGEKEYQDTILLPAAQDDGLLIARAIEAYRTNQHVTQLAVGLPTTTTVPLQK